MTTKYILTPLMVTEAGFNGYDTYSLPLPPGYDAVVLCYRQGAGGLRPICISLPHQIYTHKLQEFMANNPGVKDFWILPIKSADYILIAEIKPQ